MADFDTENATSGQDHRLSPIKNALSCLSKRDMNAALHLLPLRERSLLRLLYFRGASPGELAGILGVPRAKIRRMVVRAVARVADPENVALVRQWRHLTPEERRLAQLNRFLGVPFREIARLDLAAAAQGRGGSLFSRTAALRAMMRKIERKVARRAAHGRSGPERRTRGQPRAGPAGAG